MSEHECIACSREIPDGSMFQICEKCYQKIEFIDDCLCAKCGEKLTKDSPSCDLCKERDYQFNKNVSATYYTDVPAKIVKNFKFYGRKYYSKWIADIMFETLGNFENVDVITFVPHSKTRRRQRGFNQAEEIAKEFGKLIKKDVVKLLVKKTEGKHQARLSQSERLVNLKDSFSVYEENKGLIKNKTILIIDDVFTTGTTLSECAKVLKKHKAKTVLTATFAKTKFNSINNH